MVHLLFTALLLALSSRAAQGADAQAEEAAAAVSKDVIEERPVASVRVELISSAGPETYGGALAILVPVEALPSQFHARPRVGVRIAPISGEGAAEFDGLEPGLFQLHLIDALGAPFLAANAPVLVSAVPGVDAEHRVDVVRLFPVEGAVVESSVGAPLAGASIRVDPRYELRVAPFRSVATDSEGLYDIFTARTHLMAIESPDYKALNIRFGPSPTAGTGRMRAMIKRRSVCVTRSADGRPRRASDARLTYLPAPWKGAAESAESQGSVVGENEAGPDGRVEFLNVPYRRALLELPIVPRGGEARGARWLHELVTFRGGGKQSVTFPEVDLRAARLDADPALFTSWRIECGMLVDPSTLLLFDPRSDPPHAVPEMRLPNLPEGASTPEWTLYCKPLAQASTAGEYQLRWRGEGRHPAASGSTELLREVRAHDVQGPTAIVFDGEWLGHGRFHREEASAAAVPAIGAGDLYGSSLLMRGDIVRQRVTAESDAEVSLRLPEVPSVGHLDVQFCRGEVPIRGLALRVVQKDAVIADEILDLLGETALVTDASGTVYLRDFVPGEYELRFDASRSLSDTVPEPIALQIAAGTAEPRVVTIP